jgi:RNA polymerase sigma factor (sigma-70 family)
MFKTWEEMTPKEREAYINQDYVPRKYFLLDPETIEKTFDSVRHNIASFYVERSIPEYDVRELLATLTPRQREVITLLYLEGYTQEAAASKLGIKRRSLRTHVICARRRLKTCYQIFIKK